MASEITEAIPTRREVEEKLHAPMIQRTWEAMENIPRQFYYFAAAGSLIASVLLFIYKRRESANFVGLWPPTFLILAIMNRLVQRSKGS